MAPGRQRHSRQPVIHIEPACQILCFYSPNSVPEGYATCLMGACSASTGSSGEFRYTTVGQAAPHPLKMICAWSATARSTDANRTAINDILSGAPRIGERAARTHHWAGSQTPTARRWLSQKRRRVIGHTDRVGRARPRPATKLHRTGAVLLAWGPQD